MMMPTGAENVRCHGDDLILETPPGRTPRCDLPGHTQAAGDRPAAGIRAAAGKPAAGAAARVPRLCCRLLRSLGGLRLCRYGRTASCAEGAVFGDLCSAFFTKSHKFLPSFRADTRSRHAAAVSPRINFYCFYYNKFDFGCKCLSGNFKKTVSRSSHVLSAAAKAREAYAFFQNKPGF